MSIRRFLPGSTIGVMGGGQLGRMFALEAHRMGYRVHTFSPDAGSSTGQVGAKEYVASYDDEAAVRKFARGIDVLTFEFENIPVQCAEWAAEHCEVRPAGRVLHICQHRLREKEFLAASGVPLPPFRKITTAAELKAAVEEIGAPAVLKSASFGYDGKGQRKILPGDDLDAAWAPFEGTEAVLEGFVRFEKEVSVLVARGIDGAVATYPVCENAHANHILDLTTVPASLPEAVAENARALAITIAEAIGLVGLLAVEMFVLPGGELLVNEMAPRPHNSGHYSFGASVTSQFEQQLRAVCGLPLGSTESMKAAAMANLLGDIWAFGEPNWAALLALPNVKLHLYGKAGARPGRKMGHIVALGETVAEAAALARHARALLPAQRAD